MIKNMDFATVNICFSKITYGKITPTDIDGALDFGGKLFVLLEYKYKSTDLPTGQRIFFENICDAIEKGGSGCIVIVASHEGGKTVDGASCKVVKYRLNGKWIIPKNNITVKRAIDIILERHYDKNVIAA